LHILQVKKKQMERDFSYNDLIRFIQNTVLSNNISKEKLKKTPDYGCFTCLENQFFHIICFPAFTMDYISPNVQSILGFETSEMSMRQIFQIIHPQDRPIIMLATKKIVEILAINLPQMTPLKTIFSLVFRVNKKDGTVITLLNHNCVYKKLKNKLNCKIISISTDVTNVSALAKVEFGLMNYGDPIDIIFPDEELRNLSSFFTNRERQILSLLAAGKSSTEIGNDLYISRHTVDTHRRNMLAKSHLCNTTELVAFTLQNHLID
jgi:DNA-binding CsgD family transcriptional regulator